jgi:hypothetical protein
MMMIVAGPRKILDAVGRDDRGQKQLEERICWSLLPTNRVVERVERSRTITTTATTK